MENKNEYKLLEGEFGKEINLIDFTKKIVLNSYGGDLLTGFGAYDLLKPIEDSEAGVIGVAASSTTIALLGASERWGTRNSKYCIHNPHVETSGDATHLEAIAAELKIEENKLASIYVAELNINEAKIRDLMNKDELFDAAYALEIGMIHKIKDDQLKTVEAKTAKEMFFNLKKEEMNKEELNKELDTKFTSWFATLKNLLPGSIKNIVLKDAKGIELDFGVDTVEEIVVGTTVKAAGSAAEGEFVLENGKTIVAKGGVVDEIKEPESDEETEALKTENEDLKNKLAESEKAKVTADETIVNLQAGVTTLKTEMANIKNIFTKKINNIAIPEDDDKRDMSVNRSARKKKE